MRHYRVYIVDQGAHITEPPIEIDCKDDGEAVNAAEQLVDGHDDCTLRFFMGHFSDRPTGGRVRDLPSSREVRFTSLRLSEMWRLRVVCAQRR